MSRGRILVTDGETRAVVAVARGLATDGFDVTVAATAPARSAPAQLSRSVGERLIVSDPLTEPEPFLDALERAVSGSRYDALIPGTDASLLRVSFGRARLEPHVRLGLPAHELVKRNLDKSALVADGHASWLGTSADDLVREPGGRAQRGARDRIPGARKAADADTRPPDTAKAVRQRMGTERRRASMGDGQIRHGWVGPAPRPWRGGFVRRGVRRRSAAGRRVFALPAHVASERRQRVLLADRRCAARSASAGRRTVGRPGLGGHLRAGADRGGYAGTQST